MSGRDTQMCLEQYQELLYRGYSVRHRYSKGFTIYNTSRATGHAASIFLSFKVILRRTSWENHTSRNNGPDPWVWLSYTQCRNRGEWEMGKSDLKPSWWSSDPGSSPKPFQPTAEAYLQSNIRAAIVLCPWRISLQKGEIQLSSPFAPLPWFKGEGGRFKYLGLCYRARTITVHFVTKFMKDSQRGR